MSRPMITFLLLLLAGCAAQWVEPGGRVLVVDVFASPDSAAAAAAAGRDGEIASWNDLRERGVEHDHES